MRGPNNDDRSCRWRGPKIEDELGYNSSQLLILCFCLLQHPSPTGPVRSWRAPAGCSGRILLRRPALPLPSRCGLQNFLQNSIVINSLRMTEPCQLIHFRCSDDVWLFIKLNGSPALSAILFFRTWAAISHLSVWCTMTASYILKILYSAHFELRLTDFTRL